MNLAAYLRVSTDDQRDKGTIATQREEIRHWAEHQNDPPELFFFEDNGQSGATALQARPAAWKMLRALDAREVEGVVCWKLDRLSRDPAIFLPLSREWQLRGIRLISITEGFDLATPSGEMSSTILSAVARYERLTIIQRSIAGQNRVAKAGHWLGGIVPYGYRLAPERKLRISEDLIQGMTVSEADVVRQVFRRCTEDRWGSYRIADELNAMCVPTAYSRDERETSMGEIAGTRAKEGKRLRRTAGTWSGAAVIRMLHAEIYAGTHRFGRSSKQRDRELIARDMPAIITPAIFERTKQQLRANLRFAERNSKRAYALRGLLTCASCGHVLVGCHYPTKNREVLQYTCASHPKGDRPPRVWAGPLEAAFWADIRKFVENPDAVLRAIVEGEARETVSEGDAEKGLLRTAKAIEEIARQEKRALDFALQQIEMTPGVLEQKLAELRARRAELEGELGALRQKRARAATSGNQARSIRELLAAVAKSVRRATPAQRAAAFRLLIKTATIERRGDTHRVAVTYAFGRTEQPAVVAITSATDLYSWPAACRALRRRAPRRPRSDPDACAVRREAESAHLSHPSPRHSARESRARRRSPAAGVTPQRPRSSRCAPSRRQRRPARSGWSSFRWTSLPTRGWNVARGPP
jgi:site-specific DNA recombinase